MENFAGVASTRYGRRSHNGHGTSERLVIFATFIAASAADDPLPSSWLDLTFEHVPTTMAAYSKGNCHQFKQLFSLCSKSMARFPKG